MGQLYLTAPCTSPLGLPSGHQRDKCVQRALWTQTQQDVSKGVVTHPSLPCFGAVSCMMMVFRPNGSDQDYKLRNLPCDLRVSEDCHAAQNRTGAQNGLWVLFP